MLLFEFGVTRDIWDRVRGLAADSDDEIAVHACAIGLTAGPIPTSAICVLNGALLRQVAWPLHREVEDCLESISQSRASSSKNVLTDGPDRE